MRHSTLFVHYLHIISKSAIKNVATIQFLRFAFDKSNAYIYSQ